MRVAKVERVSGGREAFDITVEGSHCYFAGPGVLVHNCSADYVNGKLVRVLTRGGGDEGEDITRNASHFQGVKQQVPTNFTGSLRGEVLFFDNDFAAYNAEALAKGWKVFQNKRNGASGLARRTSGDGVRHLRVLFYDLVSEQIKFKSRFELMGYIQNRLGLFTPWYAKVKLDGLVRTYNEYHSERRAALPYEIDGLVVKVDDLEHAADVEEALQKSVSNTNPKSQIAWKFESETRVTVLEDILWELGVGGRVTPVAVLRPVKLCGVEIRRASLANASRVRELNLWKGCKVLISRRNDVIPYIERNLEP